MRRLLFLLAAAIALIPLRASGAAFPRVDHVVIIIEENKSLDQILGNRNAPYINQLMRGGALFVRAHAVTHPSQPNYFALFSGLVDTNGDGCPPAGIPRNAPNIASELLASGRGFAGYAETMPQAGFTGCRHGKYARKHVPWVQFGNVPASDSRPFSALRSYDDLPALTMIIPNLDDDMHDGTIAMGDVWLRRNIAPLLQWGRTHRTLFVLTWDEGGGFDPQNQIPTLFYGPMVKPGRYEDFIDHYAVLRTLEDIFGLKPTGTAVLGKTITDCWR